jgi:PAS domain S-box-containing protein
MLYYDTPHAFTDNEVRVASSIARFVAGAIDRKRNEVELRRSREHLSLALEASAMGTWEWDLASGQVVWSPALERVHGLEPGTFPGTFEAFQRDIVPEHVPAVLDAVRQATENGAAYRLAYQIRRPDGALRWIETQGTVVRDDAGAPVRMVGVCTDVTDRRAGEVERARLLQAEHSARLEAETLAARLDTLQRVTAELSRAVALEDVVAVVLGTAVHELGGRPVRCACAKATTSSSRMPWDTRITSPNTGAGSPSLRICRLAKRSAPAARCSSAPPKSGITGTRSSPPRHWFLTSLTRSSRLPITTPSGV